LVSEFFGLSSGAVQALCTSAKSGINSCRVVAESRYAVIGRFRFVGQIPTAAAGVMFYAFMAMLGILNFAKKGRFAQGRFAMGFALSLIALAGDAVLLYLSVAVIKAVCTLCSLSYVASIGLFASALAGMKRIDGESAFRSFRGAFMENIRHELFILAAIALASFFIGIASSALTRYAFERQARERQITGELLLAYRDAAQTHIDTSDAPVEGNPNAPVKLVLFIDFTCDHCARAGKNISLLLKEFPKDIAVFYKNYPLCGHCPSPDVASNEPCCIAALASVCAHRQGNFRAMYDALYRNLESGKEHSLESVSATAKNAGFNLSAFESCLASTEAGEHIVRDIDAGEHLGITGTPVLFVNGRRIPNRYLSTAALKGLVTYILQR
jgi:protein-disulfide isomerase/uncharacterized membrane protein